MPAAEAFRSCSACGGALDSDLHARCDVCGGDLLCLTCARVHLCTPQCRERGCLPGLCVRVVTGGVVSEDYGIAGVATDEL